MLKNKALYPSKLDQDSLILIARKETSLKCQILKDKPDINRLETLIHEINNIRAKGPIFDVYFKPPEKKDKKSKKIMMAKEASEFHGVKLKLKGARIGKQEVYSLYFTDMDNKHILKISIIDIGEITILETNDPKLKQQVDNHESDT